MELEEDDCKHMACNWKGIMPGKTGRVWVTEALNQDGSSQGLKIKNGLTENFGLPGQISMEAVEGSVTSSSIKLMLENETDLKAVFNDEYRLQKYEDEVCPHSWRCGTV